LVFPFPSLDRGDESVSSAGYSLDESRIGGGITQGLAQFVNGGVQAVIEVYERVARPEALLQLLARDHFSGVLKQNGQDLKWLFL